VSDTTAGLAELIDPGAELRVLGSGYQFTEGPVWITAERCLEFVDIPGDTRWRWTEERGMEVALQPMFKASGLALDVDGHLLAAEGLASQLSRFRDGVRETVAYHFRGEYLNSPNDIAVRSDGSIYFTDPDYGRWNDWIGLQRTKHRPWRGVFRVPPGGGELELVVAED
jgi:gluconolactonase